MAVQIQLRRGTAAQWTSADTVLAQGEVGVETDTGKLKVGDGVTAWTSLAYQTAPSDFIDISTIEKGGLVVGSASGETVVLPVGANGTVLGVSASDPTTVGWVSAPTLDSLSDVTITSPVAGSLLQYNGSAWIDVSDVDVLTTNRDLLTALVWGASAGYFSQAIYGDVFKWTFPTDVTSYATTVPNGPNYNKGFSNPSVAGYIAEGAGGYFMTTPSNRMYKFIFQLDSISATTSAPENLRYGGAFSNPAVAGYYARGKDASFNSTSTLYKWTFPVDSVSTTTSAPTGMAFNNGFANTSVAGYMSRGDVTSTVYKWAFPADTVTTTTAAPTTMAYHAGFANPSVAGYFSQGRGVSSTPSTTVYKWTFPADSVSTTTSSPGPMGQHAGFANPTVAGYFCAGESAAAVYKWSFPTDSAAVTTPSPSTLFDGAGLANGY